MTDKWDLFISHASEDKDDFVRPLVERLKKADLTVWYDEFSLRLGDSLRRSIEKGLAGSRFGVVVLSPAFFAKEWPQRELDALTSLEISGKGRVLPIWLNIDHDMVQRHSLLLADKVAVLASEGFGSIVSKLNEAIYHHEDVPLSRFETQRLKPRIKKWHRGKLSSNDSYDLFFSMDEEYDLDYLYILFGLPNFAVSPSQHGRLRKAIIDVGYRNLDGEVFNWNEAYEYAMGRWLGISKEA